MKKTDKVIITCAVTGSIHTPTMSPYLPITPDEIAEEAIAAAEAGAAMLHLHARDPETAGRAGPGAVRAFLPRIKQSTDAVINITTGGAPGMTLEDRLARRRRQARNLLAEHGLDELRYLPGARRYNEWKHDWEKPLSRDDRRTSSSATPSPTSSASCSELGLRNAVRVRVLRHRPSLQPCPFPRSRARRSRRSSSRRCSASSAASAPIPENLMHMKRTADRLFGEDYLFSVLARAATRCRSPRCPPCWAATSGSGWRTASISAGASSPQSTPSRCERSARILEELSLTVATPDEARAMMQTKGGDNVSF